MADELTQSGFDDTIDKLKDEIAASGDKTNETIDGGLEVLERIIGRSVKALMSSLSEAKVMVEQISSFQEVLVEQAEEEQKRGKKNIFLFTNMKNALGGLLTLGKGSKLSDTERRREEKRSGDAVIAALTELGAGFQGLKAGIGKVLKVALNPLGAIGAIVGIAIGTIAGLATTISKVLNLPGLLKGLFAPFKFLLSSKSKMGKALLKVVTNITKGIPSFVKVFSRVAGMGKALLKVVTNITKGIGSFVKVFIRVAGFVARMLPFVDDLLKFIKPMIKIGLKLSRVISKAFLPLTIAISIFKAVTGFMDELAKGGDILDASLRAIGDVLDFLSFGLLNTDQLKKFIGEPIREFIGGIKELFTEGFSIKTLKKIFEPLIKLMLAGPDIVIQAVGKLTAFIAEKLGFKNFADKLQAFLKDFNLFGFINEAIQSVIDFFMTIPAKIAAIPDILGSIGDSIINAVKTAFKKFMDDPLGTVKEIGETIINMFTSLVDGLIGFIIDNAPDALLPQELKDLKQTRAVARETAKEIARVQEEMGGASIEEAKAEQERRRKLAQLVKDQEVLGLAFQSAQERGFDDAAQKLSDKSLGVQNQIRALKAAAPGIKAGGIVTRETFARVAETEAEVVIPLSRLDELVVNPAIASALLMADKMAVNARLRDKAGTPTVIAPVAAPTIIQGGGGGPIPIIAPLSQRNSENTLQRVADRNFRSMP